MDFAIVQHAVIGVPDAVEKLFGASVEGCDVNDREQHADRSGQHHGSGDDTAAAEPGEAAEQAERKQASDEIYGLGDVGACRLEQLCQDHVVVVVPGERIDHGTAGKDPWKEDG